MEVYKITCKINNKVYIGSTKFTKEQRWGDLSSSSSHLSCARDNIDKPLYNDIRKYGKDNFIIETLEYVSGTRKDAYKREDFWIKKFWNELGAEMMYNKWDLAKGCRDWSVPHNPEMQKKSAKIRQERYGTSNAKMITPEAIEKAKQTKMKKYGKLGPIISKEGKKIHDIKVSNKILDTYDNEIIIGYKGVYNKLNKEGYNLTFWVSRRLVNGIISQKNILKYPKLEKMKNRFKILNKRKTIYQSN